MSVFAGKILDMTRCTRYSADGDACQTNTSSEDGWCRENACAGFTRPDIKSAPVLKGVKYYGGPDEIAATRSQSVDLKRETAKFGVSAKTIRLFRFHHGSAEGEAVVQLRRMLADFVIESGRVVSSANYLVLSREGYRLQIAPNRETITGYSTTHRELTWEQVKLGIPSRIGPIEAEPMPLLSSELVELVSPAPVVVSRPKPKPTDVANARRRSPVVAASQPPAATDERLAVQPDAVNLSADNDATKAPPAVKAEAACAPQQTKTPHSPHQVDAVREPHRVEPARPNRFGRVTAAVVSTLIIAGFVRRAKRRIK
jgi:hypothetical protein